MFKLNDKIKIVFDGHPADGAEGVISKVYIHPDETGASWYSILTGGVLPSYTLPETYLVKLSEEN